MDGPEPLRESQPAAFPAGVSARPARESDAARLADLATQLGYPADPAATTRRLQALASRVGTVVLVAVDSADQPIGFAHLDLVQPLVSDSHLLIHALVVDAAWRGQRIGEALMALAEAHARSVGAASVLVRSNVLRADAHRFYKRLGFAERKTQLVLTKPV